MGSCYSSHNARLATLPSDLLPFDNHPCTAAPVNLSLASSNQPAEIVRQSELEKSQPDLLHPLSPPPLPYSRPSCLVPSHRTVPDHLIPFTRAPIESLSVASTGPGPARSIVRTINQSIVVPSKVFRFELPVAVKLQAPVPTNRTVSQQQQPRNFGKKAPIPTPRYSPKRLQQAVSGNLPGHSPSRALVVPPSVNRVVQLYQVSFVDSNSIELTNISESEDISSSTSTPCHPKPVPVTRTSPKKKKKKKSLKSAGLSHLLTVARHQRALRQSQPSFLDQLKARSVRLLQIARPKSNSSGMSHPFSSSSSKVHPGGSQLKPPQAAYQSSRPVGKQQPTTTRNLATATSSQEAPSPGPKPAAKSSGLRMPTAFSTMFGASRLPLSSSKSIGNVSSTTNTTTDHHQLTPVNSICSSLSGSSPSVDSSSRQSNSHRSSSRSRLPSARNTASPTDPKFLKSSSSSNLPATTTVPVSLFSAKPNPKVTSTTTTTANKPSKSQPQGSSQSQANKPVPSQIKSPVVVASSSSSSTGPELPPRHAQVPPPLPLKSQQYQNQRLNFLFGSIATTAETTTTTTTTATNQQQQQSPSRTQPVNNVVPVRQHPGGPRVATIARPVQISQLQRNSNLPGASRLKSPSLVNSELKQSSCPYKRPHSQQPTPVSSFLMGSQPVNQQQSPHSAGPNYYNFVRNAVTRLNGTGTTGEPTQDHHHQQLVKTRLAGPRPRQLEMMDSNGGNFDNMAGSRKAIVAQSDSQILSERLANSCSLRSSQQPVQQQQQQSVQPVLGYQLTYSKRTRPIGTLTNSLATNTTPSTTTATSTQSTRNRLSVTRTNNGGNSGGGDDIGGDAPSQAAAASSARQVVLAASAAHLANNNNNNNNANCYEDKKKNNSRDNSGDDSGTGLTGVMENNNNSSSCPNSPQRHPNLLRPFLLEQAQTAPGSPRLTTTATNNNINWHHQYSPNRSSGSGNSGSEQTENWLGSPQAKQSQQQQQQQHPYDTDEDINTLSSCSSVASSSTPANNQPVDPTGQLTASCCSTASTASSFYFEQGFYTSGKNFGPEAQRPGTNTTASSTSQDSVSNRDLFLIDDEIADQPDLQFQMMMSPATTARSTNTRPLYLDLASRNVPSGTTSASTPSAGPDSPSSAQSSLTPTNPNSQQSNRSHSSQRRLSQSQSVPGESMLRSIHDELYSLISSNNNQSGREVPSSGQLLNEFASLPSDCLVTSDICDYSSSGLGDEHSVPSSPKAQGPRVRGSASLRKRHSYTASNSGPVFRRPRPLSFVENDDGSFGFDSSSFRAVSQDMMGIKTLLFRLQGVLQNAPTQSPFETSTGTGTSSHYSNRSSLDSLPSSDRLSIGSIYSDPNHHLSSTATADELVPILRQENFDLQQHIQLLEQQLTDKDRTIRLLQQQMSKYAGRHCLVVHPSQRHSQHRQSQQSQSVNLTNSTTQTEQCSNSINPRALSDGSDGGQLVRFCCSHEMDLV